MPVTDAMLRDPAPGDWLMWRRTLNGWGYSPLDQIDRDNVSRLRMVWTRALGDGSQQGTPLAYGGVLYMPNPRDLIQAIDAVTGDLIWEHRRDNPDDVYEKTGGFLSQKQPEHRHPRPARHRHQRRRPRLCARRRGPAASSGTRRYSTTRPTR